ncbi:MAG: response regulator transcription factor [Crocinitomicaceae bacterium]|nr:response regulator transcription factor [Crocinitomicaceae bacterium]
MKVIIVEDEYTIALDTEMKLTAQGFMVLGIANDFVSLMEIMSEDTPDIILMDINLGEGGSGIDISKKLKKIISVPIVFLSAYSNPEVVSAALETEPFGYLVKPYKVEDLVITMQLAKSQWLAKMAVNELKPNSETVDSIYVQSGTKLVKIDLSEILFLQALDNYSIIQTEKNKVVVSLYLSQLAEKFPVSQFFQIHRSYIVNLKNIQSIDGNTVHVGKFEIPVSRSNKADFLSRLKLV